MKVQKEAEYCLFKNHNSLIWDKLCLNIILNNKTLLISSSKTCSLFLNYFQYTFGFMSRLEPIISECDLLDLSPFGGRLYLVLLVPILNRFLVFSMPIVFSHVYNIDKMKMYSLLLLFTLKYLKWSEIFLYNNSEYDF